MDKKPDTPAYTGDIARQAAEDREYTAANQEIDFTPEQHAIWADLYAGIHRPYLLEHICREYSRGMELLRL
ncbi:MAG TPA: hypothetical protein VF813_12310, partial [Anaerolineaceae bacterium]